MSKRLAALDAEIELLRRQFLPDPFDPIGAYPDLSRVQAHTRAFLVLGHAAIETYLEEAARELVRAAEEVWKRRGRIAPPLSFLLAFTSDRLKMPTRLPGPGGKDGPQLLADQVTKVFQAHYTSINQNHGVKESNVLELFGPLGVPAAAFGTALVPNLEALGSLRGVHAHNSSKAVKAVLDPEDQYKKLRALLADIVLLDQWVAQHKRRIR